MKKNHTIVDIDCEVLHETDAAYLIDVGHADNYWVPKSQCDWDECGTMQMPQWLVEAKGIA